MQVVNAFQAWLSKFCQEERPINTIAGEELDGFICNYIMMKKKKNGEDFEPDSLTSMHRGILRYVYILLYLILKHVQLKNIFDIWRVHVEMPDIPSEINIIKLDTVFSDLI